VKYSQRYHIDIHPELGGIQYKAMPARYTKHAEERAYEKRIELASFLDILPGQVFELERLPCSSIKLAVRKPYDGVWDVCYVLIPQLERKGKLWTVVTVWKNKIEDKHFTLDKSQYADGNRKRKTNVCG
jgi:hypothetical protein